VAEVDGEGGGGDVGSRPLVAPCPSSRILGQPRHAGDRANINSNTNRDGTRYEERISRKPPFRFSLAKQILLSRLIQTSRSPRNNSDDNRAAEDERILAVFDERNLVGCIFI
jgi:hypothetical protein